MTKAGPLLRRDCKADASLEAESKAVFSRLLSLRGPSIYTLPGGAEQSGAERGAERSGAEQSEERSGAEQGAERSRPKKNRYNKICNSAWKEGDHRTNGRNPF